MTPVRARMISVPITEMTSDRRQPARLEKKKSKTPAGTPPEADETVPGY
jgi:hypothetical protein